MGKRKDKQENVITCNDILGKEAIDPEGAIIGTAIKVHIDRKTKKLIGITIDEGFMKPDLFMGMNYIKQFGTGAILLKRMPPTKFKGLKVLTSNGKIIGKVKKVIMPKKKIKKLIVSSKKFLGKKHHIKSSEIKEIGERVVLKKGHRLEDKK